MFPIRNPRTQWEIDNLQDILNQANINLNQLHYHTGIDIIHLEQILANHGSCPFRHHTISKIEKYFLKNHQLKVNKVKIP